MIQGIFYARFFPQEGTKIVAQSPPGCIVPVDSSPQRKPCLFEFEVLQEYIIPRKGFFNRYIAVNDPDSKYAILGFPVAIADPKYQRNEFIFNFGLVVEADNGDQIPYERVVRRLAVTFAEMEKQNEYLSRDGEGAGDGARRPIESLLEIIKEDLNNYGECMIPVDDANTINMKLFPHHRTPPDVKGWHVPVAKMKFADVVDPTWDLTLQKVIAHIDGVSDVRRIAFAADVSLDLTKLALRHLLYYDTILLLDMFFFGSCYAPRPGIHDFIANVSNDGYYTSNTTGPTEEDIAGGVGMSTSAGGGGGGGSSGLTGTSAAGSATTGASHASGIAIGAGTGSSGNTLGIVDECANYVCIMSSGQRVSNYQLIKLMTTFCVGRTVAEWLRLHMDAGFDVLRYIDVRRLVQFGVIKGLLYRVHKYVVSKQYLAALVTGQSRPLGNGAGGTTTTTTTTNSYGKKSSTGSAGAGAGAGDPLQKYMDGMHSFDQIITEMNLTDGEIMDKLKSFAAPTYDLTVLYR
ncbi:nitrogen permease regulator 2 [Coniella lustricola]|uniref:Nitrogen permease regulator 2 n=1 Tax=Coniella lustricola TaxID=2025994 RepID=A0A2T2ZYL8_9PEZI|nr:nitrogen permease regulator 2 [Coniella lustricola]